MAPARVFGIQRRPHSWMVMAVGAVFPGEAELADVRAFNRRSRTEDAPIETCSSKSGEFEDVFRRYGKPVLSFVYSMTGNRSQAEEITQETFTRAFFNFHTKKLETRISTWLFGIAHNVVREAVKRKYRDVRAVALDGPGIENLKDSGQSADDRVIARETSHRVQDALASLPEDHRLAFVLKMIYRLQYEEISAITGSSVGKLKTDMHRARMEMRRKLQPYLGGDSSRMRGES